jgi:hypothetical protein
MKVCAYTYVYITININRLEAFNKALEEACKRHSQVTFISFNDVLTNPNKTVKQEYIDLNPVNPHLLWEPLILLFAEYIDTLDVGVSPNMLTDMQESASTYTAKKIVEVGDKTFYVGPKMQLIMDYLNEKNRYLDESRERNLNKISNVGHDNDPDDDDDPDDEVECAIALSQHESKIEDIINQLRIIDEERALEKLKIASKEKIHMKDLSLIPIPPPNMPNNNRNTTINDKNQIKKVVVSGDSRNLKNTNDNDTNRHRTELWPVLSENSGNLDDSESRNSNQKNAKSSSRFHDGSRNHDINSKVSKFHDYNVSSPDNEDSERRSIIQKNDRNKNDDDRRKNNDNNVSSRNNHYYVSSPGDNDSERSNDNYRNTRHSNSTNYNDRSNNYNTSNDRRHNNDNNVNNKSRNGDNDSSFRSSSSSNNSSSYNSNNNYDNDSSTYRNNNNYRSNNNYNTTNYNANNNNNRSDNNYSNNNRINNNGGRSQQINYQDELASQSNRPPKVILSNKISRDHAPRVILSDQDRRRGSRDDQEQGRAGGNWDDSDRRWVRDGDGGQGSNQGRRGSRGSRDGEDEDDKSYRSARIVLSDQRQGNRGNREEGEEPDNIQGVQTLSLSDRFQMFNRGRGKIRDR